MRWEHDFSPLRWPSRVRQLHALRARQQPAAQDGVRCSHDRRARAEGPRHCCLRVALRLHLGDEQRLPAQANVAASAAAQAAAGNSQAAAGNSGVRSAKASAPKNANKHASVVLSAEAALASTAKKPLRLLATVRHGNLPFTGFALWMPMALGLGLIATGLAMRRRGTSLT